MKNIEIIKIGENLKNSIHTLKSLSGSKFVYTLTKNINLINDEMKNIVAIIEPNEEYVAYDEERVSMCEKHSKKDENGVSIQKNVANNQTEYDIDLTSKNWIKDLNILKEKYNNAILFRENQIKEYEKFLNDENDIKFHMININDVPEQISLEQISLIDFFIEE